ncbi:hypothetical protein [Lentilactobacillus otakiensis]
MLEPNMWAIGLSFIWKKSSERRDPGDAVSKSALVKTPGVGDLTKALLEVSIWVVGAVLKRKVSDQSHHQVG